MPRKTKAKDMKSECRSNRKSSALKFIASLFFLYVIIMGLRNASTWGTYVVGTSWAPLLIAIAVMGTLALFFGSIASVICDKCFMGGKMIYVTAFALIALTVSVLPNASFWFAIVGFAVGWIAIMMKECC